MSEGGGDATDLVPELLRAIRDEMRGVRKEVSELRTETHAGLDQLRAELDQLRRETREGFTRLATAISVTFATRDDLATVRAEMSARIDHEVEHLRARLAELERARG